MKLREYAKTLNLEVGCGDNSCIWGPPGGMGTQGIREMCPTVEVQTPRGPVTLAIHTSCKEKRDARA